MFNVDQNRTPIKTRSGYIWATRAKSCAIIFADRLAKYNSSDFIRVDKELLIRLHTKCQLKRSKWRSKTYCKISNFTERIPVGWKAIGSSFGLLIFGYSTCYLLATTGLLCDYSKFNKRLRQGTVVTPY